MFDRRALFPLVACLIASPQFAYGQIEITSAEAKARIQLDIEERKAARKSETDKLQRLYRERSVLNPDQRLSDVVDRAARLSVESMKSAVKQAKDGPVNTPKKAADAIERGKDLVGHFKGVYEAIAKVDEEDYRQQTIENDISKQERKVREATAELEAATAASAIVMPILDAIAESERIAAVRQMRIRDNTASHGEAVRQTREYKPLPPGPALRRTDAWPGAPPKGMAPTLSGPQINVGPQPPVPVTPPPPPPPPASPSRPGTVNPGQT